MTAKLQNTLIIFGLIAIAGIGFYLFKENGDISLNNTLVDNQVAVDTAQFLKRLNELKGIKLDGSVLIDERFTSLVDYSSPVIPLPIGKENPFAVNN